jgi:hypothetical protein
MSREEWLQIRIVGELIGRMLLLLLVRRVWSFLGRGVVVEGNRRTGVGVEPAEPLSRLVVVLGSGLKLDAVINTGCSGS